jgi:glycosyltransferase involved in cell wall biosynthesis
VRVAFLVPRFDPGGIATFLLRLGAFLQANGCEVSVIASQDEGAWWNLTKTLGWRCACLARRLSPTPIAHARAVGRFLADYPADVVLLNQARYAQAALAMLPERIAAVAVAHSDHPDIYRVTCANAKAVNAVVGISPRVYETLRKRMPGRPVVEIPHGVEPVNERLREIRAAFEEPVRLLYVGSLYHRHKGVLLLPDILQACLRRGLAATLTVIGDGPDLARLRTRLGLLRLEEHVTLQPGLLPAAIPGQMLNHHVLLMPSSREGFGLVLLEAQACGCVPVASCLPGVTDRVVEDRVTGCLVAKGDVNGFADAVETLCRNPRRWREMGDAGTARVRERFSVEAMGQAYLTLFADALSGRYPCKRGGQTGARIALSPFTWRDWVPPAALARIRRALRRQ